MFYAAPVEALGEHEEAAPLAQVALEFGQQVGWPDSVQLYGSQMSLHWMFEGQLETFGALVGPAIVA